MKNLTEFFEAINAYPGTALSVAITGVVVLSIIFLGIFDIVRATKGKK